MLRERGVGGRSRVSDTRAWAVSHFRFPRSRLVSKNEGKATLKPTAGVGTEVGLRLGRDPTGRARVVCEGTTVERAPSAAGFDICAAPRARSLALCVSPRYCLSLNDNS